MRDYKFANLSLCISCVFILFLFGCTVQPAPSNTTERINPSINDPIASVTPQNLPSDSQESLTRDQAATLSSLQKIDDYPLYTMHYTGELPGTNFDITYQDSFQDNITTSFTSPDWACSLFAALGGDETHKFGRNFDWVFSPGLLLFTNPGDGYASASMVDIAYLGFEVEVLSALDELDLAALTPMLKAPNWPFDGMNEAGLAIGMAAVPGGQMKTDHQKPTIGSLEIMRQVLDNAADIQEALNIIGSYNIDFRGGPDLHYLIADRSGDAVLVEFFDGNMHIIHNTEPWHMATNFLVSSVDNPEGQCTRYDKISDTMLLSGGNLNSQEASKLLSKVSQTNTQWSVVYNLDSGDIEVTMGRQVGKAHQFHLAP